MLPHVVVKVYFSVLLLLLLMLLVFLWVLVSDLECEVCSV